MMIIPNVPENFNRNMLEALSNYLLVFPAQLFDNLSVDFEEYYESPMDISMLPLSSLNPEYRYDALAVLALCGDFTEYPYSWDRLSLELFGPDNIMVKLPDGRTANSPVWEFLNQGGLTPFQVSRRISYLLEHGVPYDYANFEAYFGE